MRTPMRWRRSDSPFQRRTPRPPRSGPPNPAASRWVGPTHSVTRASGSRGGLSSRSAGIGERCFRREVAVSPNALAPRPLRAATPTVAGRPLVVRSESEICCRLCARSLQKPFDTGAARGPSARCADRERGAAAGSMSSSARSGGSRRRRPLRAGEVLGGPGRPLNAEGAAALRPALGPRPRGRRHDRGLRARTARRRGALQGRGHSGQPQPPRAR